MSFLLTLIGSAHTPRDDRAISDTVACHLEPAHQAVWTDVERQRWAGGMRLVAKMAGAKVLALTGTLVDGHTRADDPIEVDGRTLRFRYDVQWDARPGTWIPVEDLGDPFSQPTRTARFISFDGFDAHTERYTGTSPPDKTSTIGRSDPGTGNAVLSERIRQTVVETDASSVTLTVAST